MNQDIIAAIITFALGFVIAGLNYLLSRAILKKCPEKYVFSTIIRQVIQILYIVAVYFVSTAIPFNSWYMLIGAVLGVTVPMFFFTYKLVKLNQSINSKETDKEGENNG